MARIIPPQSAHTVAHRTARALERKETALVPRRRLCDSLYFIDIAIFKHNVVMVVIVSPYGIAKRHIGGTKIGLAASQQLFGRNTEKVEEGIFGAAHTVCIRPVVPCGVKVVVIAVDLYNVPRVTASVAAVLIQCMPGSLGTLNAALLQQILKPAGI